MSGTPIGSTTNASRRAAGTGTTPSAVAREQQPFDPRAEADRRRGRTAHLLREPVVAAATSDRVLGRVERVARQLEDGTRVVVEPAHEPRRDLERDPQRLQSFLHAREVRSRLVAQVLAELRRALEHVGPVGALGVEDAQRIRLRAFHLRADEIGVLVPVREQHLAVALARRRVAHRVDQQPHPPQPELTTEAPQQLDHLDVDVGVVDPDHLRAELPVLAVTTGLRLLGPEVRREVPHLPRRRRPVLHERAHDGRGAFGSEREPAPAPVDEVVHLLAHDVGGLADPGEDLVVLEDRRQQQAVAEAGRPAREPRDDLDPPCRIRAAGRRACPWARA